MREASLYQFAKVVASLIASYFTGWAATMAARYKEQGKPVPAWIAEVMSLIPAITPDWVIGVLLAARSESWVPAQKVIAKCIPHLVYSMNFERPECRMKLFAEVALSAFVRFGWLVCDKQAIQYIVTDESHNQYGLGFKLGTLKVSIGDEEGITTRAMVRPNAEPVDTHAVMGTAWVKDGLDLDHCEETVHISNAVPLRWNMDVLHDMGDKFELSEAKKEDWDTERFPTFEDYVTDRQNQFNSYISKIPADILATEELTVFNTNAPDSRGRLYSKNDTMNYGGIKQVRGLVQMADGEVVDLDQAEKLKDFI